MNNVFRYYVRVTLRSDPAARHVKKEKGRGEEGKLGKSSFSAPVSLISFGYHCLPYLS